MMLVKVGSLKIEGKEEAMFSKGLKLKSHHKTTDNSQAGVDTGKSKKPVHRSKRGYR